MQGTIKYKQNVDTKTQSVECKESLNANSMQENGSEKIIPGKDFSRTFSSTSSVSEGPALGYKDNTSKVIPRPLKKMWDDFSQQIWMRYMEWPFYK